MNYQERIVRLDSLEASLAGETKRLHDLIISCKISPSKFLRLRTATQELISAACHFPLLRYDENEFIDSVNRGRSDLLNITPNGAVTPKREYLLQYNYFLFSWFDILGDLFNAKDSPLGKIRLTPNLRIKFGKELDENIGRVLNTSLPHSDAWLEGPYSFNCHVPIMGDCLGNYLKFYEPIDPLSFREDFLLNSASYEDMQWVVEFYKSMDKRALQGWINISDYALIHKTERMENCGTRISIDTTVTMLDYPVHPDRECEYHNKIPAIGSEIYAFSARSECDGQVHEKPTVFSHYTTGVLKFIPLSME